MRNVLENRLALLLLLLSSAAVPAAADPASLPMPHPPTLGASSASDPGAGAYNAAVPAYNAAVGDFNRATREYAAARSSDDPAAWGTALADARRTAANAEALREGLPSQKGVGKEVLQMRDSLGRMRDYLFELLHDPDYDRVVQDFGTATANKPGQPRNDAAIAKNAADIQALLKKHRYQNREGEALYSLLGYGSVLRGDPAGAIPNLQTAVRLNPDDLDARNNLGNELQEVQPPRFAEAADQYRYVLSALQNPAGPVPKHSPTLTPDGVQLSLAMAEGQTDQTDDALAKFKEIADPSRNPSATVLKNYGYVLAKAGNNLEAAQTLERATTLDPRDAKTWLNEGELYAKAGQNDKAITALKNAIGSGVDAPLDPTSAYAAHFALAQASAAGDPNAAIAEFKTASLLQPDDPKPSYDAGVLEQQHGLNADAEASFRAAGVAAGKLDPQEPKTAGTQAQIQAALGLLLVDEGRTTDLPEAASLLSQAVAKMPQDAQTAPVYARLADVYSKQGSLDKANEARVQALALAPKDAHTRLALAAAYVKQNQPILALAQYDQAALDLPNDSAHNDVQAAIQNQRGVIYENMKMYKKAQEAFQRALALNPRLAAAQNNLGVTYELLNRKPAEALVAYKKAHKMDASLSEASFNLNRPAGSAGYAGDEDAFTLSDSGQAYFQLKQYGKALAAFTRAAKLDPDSAPILNDVGASYQGLGNLTAARAAYRKALALDPSLVVARQNLNDVRSRPRLLPYSRRGRSARP